MNIKTLETHVIAAASSGLAVVALVDPGVHVPPAAVSTVIGGVFAIGAVVVESFHALTKHKIATAVQDITSVEPTFKDVLSAVNTIAAALPNAMPTQPSAPTTSNTVAASAGPPTV